MNLTMIERAEEVELVEMNEPATEETNLTMIEHAEEVEVELVDELCKGGDEFDDNDN